MPPPLDGIMTHRTLVEEWELGEDSQIPFTQYLDLWHQKFRREDAPPLPDGLQAGAVPQAIARINSGRWVWQCGMCLTGIVLDDGAPWVLCCFCSSHGWHRVVWPDNVAEIEAELLLQPGYRTRPSVREWKPGWTMAYLKERTALAKEKLEQGESPVLSLSITGTRVFTVNEILTASNMNGHVSRPIDDLSGDNGIVMLRHALQLAGLAATRFIDYQAGSAPGSPSPGMQYYSSTLGMRMRHGSSWYNWLRTSDVDRRTRALMGPGPARIIAWTHVTARRDSDRGWSYVFTSAKSYRVASASIHARETAGSYTRPIININFTDTIPENFTIAAAPKTGGWEVTRPSSRQLRFGAIGGYNRGQTATIHVTVIGV